MSTIAIVGGGIAGLSLAFELRTRERGVNVIVLERGERPGGNIRTDVVDGYVCEAGPDGFLDNAPDTLRLVKKIGLEDRLQRSRDSARRRYVFRRGRLHEVPASPLAFVRTALLSPAAKARLLAEPFAPAPPDTDESIHAFAARRIGREAADVMIDAMVSGVFAGDAQALSLEACFPRMRQMERAHGGLFRAMIATRRRRTHGSTMGGPGGTLTSFTRGMSELVDGLMRALGGIVRTSSPAIELWPAGLGLFQVVTRHERIVADAVVLAGPSVESADLTLRLDAALSQSLRQIPSAPLAVVCLGFDERALREDRGALDGFGFLVPRCEGPRILGALWETSIYPDRAPRGKALMRVMIGGAHDRHAVDLEDGALLAAVLADLRQTMGLRLAPEFVNIVRHRRGIPQYTTGHLDRLRAIDAALARNRGLFVAGSSYRGVAINACIAESGPLADRVLDSLQSRRISAAVNSAFFDAAGAAERKPA